MASNLALRQEISAFLRGLNFFDDANSRKAILLSAGLNSVLPTIDLSGNKAEFVALVVDALAQYGEVDGQPALARLLRGIGAQVGADRRHGLASGRTAA